MAKAFLFDMNGTMIDDMHYHQRAWFDILKNLGADLTFENSKAQMYGKNEELLARIFGKGHFSAEEVNQITHRKEAQYQKDFQPHLHLINGLPAFLQQAEAQHILLAIGTAAPRTNVDFAMDGLQLRSQFPVVVDSEDVKESKPNPAVFLQCAEKLGVAPADCIVFEDSPKGVEAAKNGGMKAVVLLTFHEPADFKHLDNVLMMVKDYTDPKLQELFSAKG